MEALDFDALVVNNQAFNTLDNLANANTMQNMTQNTLQNIQAMQTPVPQGHIPQHVVLPTFQNKQNIASGSTCPTKQSGNLFFAVVNGAQKGPFTLEQLKGLAIADVINTDSMVWLVGSPEWTDLRTCLATLNQ